MTLKEILDRSPENTTYLKSIYTRQLYTRAGLLIFKVEGDGRINCRFVDVDFAKRFLSHGWADRLNPHSGKWNHSGVESFLAEVEPLLLTEG